MQMELAFAPEPDRPRGDPGSKVRENSHEEMKRAFMPESSCQGGTDNNRPTPAQ